MENPRNQISELHFDKFPCEAALDPSDPFNVSLQGDDIQDFDTRWDHAPLLASEAPKENVLESLYAQDENTSVQLQTVLAMHDQEIDRDRAVHAVKDCRL